MKTTGMVRRIDSLGRIVIPKEIRRVLKLKENEQVEINVNADEIILNKYSDINGYDIYLKNLIDIVSDVYKVNIILTDLNNVKLTTKNYLYLENKELSPYLLSLLNDRNDVLENNKVSVSISEISDELIGYFSINNLIINGDLIGLIIFVSENNSIDLNLVKFIKLYLEKYLE